MKLLAKINPKDDKIIGLYTTIKGAADELHIAAPAISQAIRLNGTSKKFKWKYIDVDETKIIDIL